MIPQLDNVTRAISTFFRLGGYSMDVGTGLVPTALGVDLSDSPAPPFRPWVCGMSNPAGAALHTYTYIGLNAGVPASTRLHIRKLRTLTSDGVGQLMLGFEVAAVGTLRVFTNNQVFIPIWEDAGGPDLQVANAQSIPAQKLPIYAIAGTDATDLAAGSTARLLLSPANSLTTHDVNIILKPGVFFWIETQSLNVTLSAEFEGRLYD